jgi:hypothetical protein
MITKRDYEMRLLVDPDKTLENGKPIAALLAAFDLDNLDDKHQQIVMQFLDSARLELNAAGWNVRLRAFHNENVRQLTYKRRYPVLGDDMAAALAHADIDFGPDPQTYEAQVEWGLEHKTLSVSLKSDDPAGGDPLDLPGERKSRELCIDKIPDRLSRETSPAWVRAVLEQAHLFGPIPGDRWKGKRVGQTVFIEVWPLRGKPGEADERLVEISFKEEDVDTARADREKLKDFLAEQGWLLPHDALKTAMILARY